ncbi:MAG: hypothetical protein QE271_12860 [Bacteriovoracaceae bacterium]|nr:hypothetical protein [Bacteriovoracaceae bacterium]
MLIQKFLLSLLFFIFFTGCYPLEKQVFYGTLVLGDAGFEKQLEIQDEANRNNRFVWVEKGLKKIIINPSYGKIEFKIFSALGTPEASFSVPSNKFIIDKKNNSYVFTHNGITFVTYHKDIEVNRFELFINSSDCWLIRHVKRFYFLTAKSGEINIMSVQGMIQNLDKYADKINKQDLLNYASANPEKTVERKRCSRSDNRDYTNIIDNLDILNAHSVK